MRRLSCLAAATGLVVTSLVVAAPAPPASARVASIGARLGRTTVDAFATTARKGHSRNSHSPRAKPLPPRLQYVVLPDCGTNDPASQVASTCAEQSLGCASGTSRMRVFEARLGTPLKDASLWSRTASRCLDPTQAHVGEVVIPQLTSAELRRLPVPAGTSVIEPPGGKALINLPVNVYATTPEPTTLRTTVMGLDMVIALYPTSYTWDFGDGTVVGPTSDPGGPYPNLTNSHVYRKPGNYAVTMTTTYRAEYAVNDGAAQPVTGQSAVSSPASQLRLYSASAELKAGND